MLLLLITSGCQTLEKITTVKIEYVLPVSPIRQDIQLSDNPEIKDYLEIIVYYEHLVQEWETWGNTVKRLLTYNED